MMPEWGVFEYKTGVVWHVTPPTEAQARYEVTQTDPGHEAFPLDVCLALGNAFSHGRALGWRQAADRVEEQLSIHLQEES